MAIRKNDQSVVTSTTFPIARLAFKVGDGEDHDFVFPNTVDN